MELAFDRGGRGQPLVLVHGTGSERGVWGRVLGPLRAEREVVAVDLPGHGTSPPPPGEAPITPARFAAAVAGLMDQLGWERAHLAGNSLGGWIALELALLGRAHSVTALSPAGFWTPREWAYVRGSLLTSQRVFRRVLPAQPALNATAAGRTLGFWQGTGRPWAWDGEDLTALARGIAGTTVLRRTLEGERSRFTGAERLRHLPVTVAWGERDRLLPRRRQAPRARRALPYARHVTLANCGHVPVGDDPELVTRTLLDGSARASS